MSISKDPYKYEQKKINHVFHYTSYFPDLQNIVRKGFIPSYCKEDIANKKYLTPMVSFCNIPIGEVDNYMRYGKNGIGMSLKWAVKNGLSPVTYTHENSPYHYILSSFSMLKFHQEISGYKHKNGKNFLGMDMLDPFALDQNSIRYKANLKLLQFLKNWETEYKGETIITYQEREWRYVIDSHKILPIIDESHKEYKIYTDKALKPKPHLPEYTLNIDNLDDIKYLVVTTERQREKIIGTLIKRFSEEITTRAILNGSLVVLNASQIRNDF